MALRNFGILPHHCTASQSRPLRIFTSVKTSNFASLLRPVPDFHVFTGLPIVLLVLPDGLNRNAFFEIL